MTLDQFRNAEWMLDYIETNAESFEYEVSGAWSSGTDAIQTFAIDDDAYRSDVGDDGLAAITAYCNSGDKIAALDALNAAYKKSYAE